MMNFSGKKNYYITLIFLRIHYNYSNIFLSLISAVLLNTVKLGDLLTVLIKGLLYLIQILEEYSILIKNSRNVSKTSIQYVCVIIINCY